MPTSSLRCPTGPWIWYERAREALLTILGEETIDGFIKEAKKGNEQGHDRIIKVPSGKAEKVAMALNAVTPDRKYPASYSVLAKGDDTVIIRSRPWNIVT